MKKFLSYIAAIAALSAVTPAWAQTIITQTVAGVSNNLPRHEFYGQINDAVSAMANDDIPRLFANANAAAAGTGTVQVLSRYPILGHNATQAVAIVFGTGATNTHIVTFNPPFTGTPVVFVRPTTYNATNAANFGASSVTPTNATINGLDDDMSWIAIGVK